jgi:NADPH2:quinone reductase
VSLHGIDLGRLARRTPEAVRTTGERLCDLCRAGTLRPAVGAQFPLAEASRAHALIEEGGHAGSVVLTTAG